MEYRQTRATPAQVDGETCQKDSIDRWRLFRFRAIPENPSISQMTKGAIGDIGDDQRMWVSTYCSLRLDHLVRNGGGAGGKMGL